MRPLRATMPRERYYLTKSRKELGYYTARAQELLSAARPLMDIYRIDNKNEFNAFYRRIQKAIGKRKSILSSLPLYTIDASLLVEMLARSGFDGEEAAGIVDAANSARQRVLHILETSEIHVKIPLLTREGVRGLSIEPRPFERILRAGVAYTYEQYLAHMEDTDRFAADHPLYLIEKASSQTFRNLQISIHEGRWAMVSKELVPSIHFVKSYTTQN